MRLSAWVVLRRWLSLFSFQPYFKTKTYFEKVDRFITQSTFVRKIIFRRTTGCTYLPVWSKNSNFWCYAQGGFQFCHSISLQSNRSRLSHNLFEFAEFFFQFDLFLYCIAINGFTDIWTFIIFWGTVRFLWQSSLRRVWEICTWKMKREEYFLTIMLTYDLKVTFCEGVCILSICKHAMIQSITYISFLHEFPFR